MSVNYFYPITHRFFPYKEIYIQSYKSEQQMKEQSHSWCKFCNVALDPRLIINQINSMHEHDEHGYTCPCPDCKMKFGNLPVLLEGIESREKVEEPLNLSGPSTSGAKKVKVMSCKQCDKKFTHKGDLKKHLRTHSGEKPFACPTCDKRFAHTSNLTRHLRVHSGDKPFSCDKCGKNFSRKDKLEAHKTTQICKKRSLVKEESTITSTSTTT